MQSPRALLVMIVAAASLFIAAACGGSTGQTCAQGTERCPCYGNSTCNPGLSCASNTCVNLGGTGGTSGGGGQGATAGTGVAGSSGTGGTVGSGGTTTAGSGGASTGGRGGSTGSGGTGGAGTGGRGGSTGSGGTGTGGSAGSCTNTTTDPNNCGACGHVCKNADPIYNGACPPSGCCAAGACGPALGACITQHDGFTTCAAYCASIGETCVQKGCYPGSVTADAWGQSADCQIARNSIDAFSNGACDAPLGLADNTSAAFGRCCCTDTH